MSTDSVVENLRKTPFFNEDAIIPPTNPDDNITDLRQSVFLTEEDIDNKPASVLAKEYKQAEFQTQVNMARGYLAKVLGLEEDDLISVTNNVVGEGLDPEHVGKFFIEMAKKVDEKQEAASTDKRLSSLP